MPQLIPVLTTAILEIWGAFVVSMPIWAPTAATYAAWAIVIGGTYASIRSMTRGVNIGSLASENAGKLTMTRDTITSRRVIYGLNRVSGPLLFASTNGSQGKNEQLHLIVGIAGHEVKDFKSVYFNDILAWNSGSGNTSAYAEDKLAFQYKIGAVSQSAYAMTPATEWTGDHTLNGIASIYTRLNADPAVYPSGIPNISAIVLGHTLQNTNLSDVNYYDNPALILLHYMRNYFGATESELNLSSFADARDACNYDVLGDGFKRYTCNYSFTLNTKPAKVIEDILKTCYGKLIYTNGQFFLKVGVYTSPTVVINDDDIIGSVAVTTKSSQANSFNSVRGLYINGPINPTSSMFLSPDKYSGSYQPSDFVPVTSSLYLAEDNGVEAPLDIELAGVTSHTVARRIAKLTLLDSRQDLTVALTTKISGIQLIAGDNVQLPLERYGWASGSGIPAGGKVFEVNELTINSDLTVNLILKETVSTIYDFPVDEDVDRDLSPNTNLPNPFFVQPPAGFTVTETTTIDADGTIFPSATMLWSSSYSGSTADVGLEFKLTSSANFDSLGTVARTDNTFTTIDVEAGKSYTFRARNQNYLGVYSNYVTQSIKILGDTTRPQAPIGGTSVGLTGSLYVQWTNSPVDKDYKFTQVWLNSANNSASAENQGTVSGTSWNKTIVQSGSYYVWLKNIDTSGNESDISSGGNAFVAGIAQGSPGPAGPSGSAGFAFTNIYKLGNIVPATPTGNIPVSGWVLGIPDNTGEALWLSSGLISSADNTTLTGSWSSPTRLSGRVSYFSNDAPVSGSNSSPVIGDIWFDTNDGNKIYRWSGTAWVSVQDEQIPSITGSILTMTSSIASVTSASLANTLNILSATGSIANLYTQSFALSSSYGATSASLNNVYATFASQDFAVAVARFSSSVSFMSATSSANAYTDTTLVSYATQTYAQTISQTTSTASFNSATASANARTDTLLTNYATRTQSETFTQQATTASFTSATGSSNAFTLTQLGGYSTTDTSQAYSRQQITASINPGGVVSASNAASVAVNAAAVASLSGSVANLSAEYGVSVTAGKVTGFKILSSPTVSDFIIQADKFAIVNSGGSGSKSPFIVSGGLTYIDGAVINRLDAGIITAGTISAAIRIDTPQITASGILVNSGLGMRCGNDSSVLTLTGGSVDSNNNGGQMDLVGNDVVGIGGVVQLIAGNEPTGHVLLKTGGDNIRLKVDYTGTVGINTSTPDTTSKLHVYGVTKAEGHVSCSGEITKITSDGFTVPMNDGSNAISQQWDGSDYNIKVDASTFTIAREGSDVSFISVNTTSSERYKKNIRNLNGSYELIDMINPVVYDLRDDSKVDQLGFIAEAVYEVLPSLVHKNKEGLVDSLDYSKFTPLLLDCVKKQKKLIEDLEARLARLENK